MSKRCFEFMDREFIKILLVSSMIEDHLSLRSLIGHSNWELHHSLSREEALGLLKERPIPVVICDSELTDGTWRDFWREISELPAPPRLIVSSRVADNMLWGEVLNLGAYDLLIKPLEASEVFRVGCLAWHSWYQEHGRGSKLPAVMDGRNMVQQVACAAAPG